MVMVFDLALTFLKLLHGFLGYLILLGHLLAWCIFKQNVFLFLLWLGGRGGSVSISLPIRDLLLRQIHLNTYEHGFWM